MLPPLSRLLLAPDAGEPEPASLLLPPTRITAALLVRVAAVVALIAALVLFVSRRILFPHQKRALTLTEINTLRNRHENGGTGVVFRKWRKLFFPPPVFGDEDELAEAEREAELEAEAAATAAAAAADQAQANGDGSGVKDKWAYTSKPAPDGLRSCLKSSEKLAAKDPASTGASASSGDGSAAGTPRVRSSDADTAAESTISTTFRSPPKRVRIVEPELEELELLRQLWSSPEMQAMTGSTGIGGFRRTRDFYSKSQGGSAVVKRPTAHAVSNAEAGSLIPATKEDDDEGVPVVAGPTPAVKPLLRLRDPGNLAAPKSARQSSLSPVPTNRRHRTLSPTSPAAGGARAGSPAFIVGSQSSAAKASPNRRRALSPATVSATGTRTASPGPGGLAADVAGPRWIRVRPHPSAIRINKDDEAAAAESSEHETTDDDGTADEDVLSPSLSATPETPQTTSSVAVAGKGATDGTATPPPSSLASVLHTLTGIDALTYTGDDLAPELEHHQNHCGSDDQVNAAGLSPANSVFSGGESPQDSPSPSPHQALHHRQPSRAPTSTCSSSSSTGPSAPPAVSVTPSSLQTLAAPLPPFADESVRGSASPVHRRSSPAEGAVPIDRANPAEAVVPTSHVPSITSSSSASSSSVASRTSNAATSSAVSPSPCVAAQDRRLSLRVQQALRDKQHKRHGSPASDGSRGSHHESAVSSSSTSTSSQPASPPVSLSV
ncbi:hypothetical protein JCM3774_003120 [Rhodotorula dairenensis]